MGSPQIIKCVDGWFPFAVCCEMVSGSRFWERFKSCWFGCGSGLVLLVSVGYSWNMLTLREYENFPVQYLQYSVSNVCSGICGKWWSYILCTVSTSKLIIQARHPHSKKSPGNRDDEEIGRP